MTLEPHRSFAVETGCALEGAEDGTARAVLEIGPEHANTYGSVHGGAISTLADFAMGAALVSVLVPGDQPALMELNVNFLVAAFGRLTATARVVHRARTVAVCEAQIRDGEGRVAARVNGTYSIQPERRREPDA